MPGIRDVDLLDPFENRGDVAPAPGRSGKAVEDRAAHGVPHQAYALHQGGYVPAEGQGGGRRVKGIAFAQGEAGGAHRVHDLVRDPLPADAAKGGSQPPGNRAVSAVEESAQQVRSIGHEGERRPCIDRILLEVPGRARDQRGGQAECAHPVQRHDVLGIGQCGTNFEQGRPVEQGGDPVASLGRAHEKLTWNGAVARVKREGLFRRQAPSRTEAGAQVRGAEAPERGIPRGAVAGAPIRRDGDVPSLHDRLQEAVPDEPLAVRAREVGGADGDDATLLEQVQGVQGTGQFL